ncbi:MULTISPECIES: histidinol-phosphate transaminase [unclassified Colwellia]|uniref:histidinol-phosphate transaminase n=1 Tax=unclassified Colwellia TaxID=196834 RepID=UPI0015F5F672|nr:MULTISPECIES: histidinol-phosphate transaminase [unclassified Colwellia]MBA6233014.1 histidinol-phosphate transaminase [Colwellia sp. MB02u-7]MBA6236692.1 histidinol-phosphate transaminase [Colwellia sp. MB02u-11]MBA6255884.1 histidinol-phosphate transaminase [Colwellia sp. MB3u-28]MBA6262026.1 histidinol-phosphate transaminase [Colwellia sp. MB3u-41]MBA6298994.1 histidinol-phosphate transaminase [Colwellia sp. MB3u-22]
MSTIADKLAREELVDMVPYQSARRLYASGSDSSSTTSHKIWLNANEASGPGIYTLNSSCINRYPDFQPDNLIKAYSEYSGVMPTNILATRGADEGIELIIRTFSKAYQDSILICPPTYGMYAISAENHGAGITRVPLVDNQLDIEAMKAQVGKVKVVFLCSPGNPTGNVLTTNSIRAALEMFGDTAIVVVDEAYIEFSPEKSTANWLKDYPQLVILRTLSKAFALAGLRCGFTLANADIITMLSKVIAPYPISAPVADIASSALAKKGLEQVTIRVQETVILRIQLFDWLKGQDWCVNVFNSDANFILFRAVDTDTKNFIFDCLKQQGILIRDQSAQQQLADCLRISIGSERELSLLKNTIANAFSQVKSET